MRGLYFQFVLMMVWTGSVNGQFQTDSLLVNILRSDTSSLVQKMMNDPEKYRIQIIYTRIDRDGQNRPSFRNYYYHVNRDYYFYPASTVKLPLALLSLEKLDRLSSKGINKFTPMTYDSSFSKQSMMETDSTSESGYPSIAHFIRKAFLISDNDAYNRMYEFVGQELLNRRLYALGYTDVRIVRQFIPMSELENRHTNAIRFWDTHGTTLYEQPAAFNRDSFQFAPTVKLGLGYLNSHDSLIKEPMDFTRHNRIPLGDLQQMLQSVLFPLSVPAAHRFELQPDDYVFLRQYLSQYPSETSYPKYDSTLFIDSYVKFFFLDTGRPMPANIRVFNKVGWAYGFLTDVAYIVDFEHRVEFMLAATVYTNEDGILNDNVYEYQSMGLPFLYRVGQTIYQYDLRRPREFKPNLENFRLHYEHRDPSDARPSIRNVDN